MISNITIKELEKVTKNIIDIRSIEKYNYSHIPNSKNIPKEQLINNPGKYLNRNEIYYIYCQYGRNSIKVCIYLTRLGYKVKNILGGYESWLLEK